MVEGGRRGGGQGRGEGQKKEKNKNINHAYKTFRAAQCKCFAEDVDLNLRGGGGGDGGERGAVELARDREGENNKRKDGNNDIQHCLTNEESRDTPPWLPRLPLMSRNSVISSCNLLFSTTVSLCCCTFKLD